MTRGYTMLIPTLLPLIENNASGCTGDIEQPTRDCICSDKAYGLD
jgi:hypothetical protein